MKTRILLLALSFCLSTTISAQEKLQINTSKSNLKWYGEYTFYFGGHDGTIDFKEGYFIKTNDVITGGEFIIDMHTIKCDDIKQAKGNASLVKHLKDPDFFDVENYATAILVITSVEYYPDNALKVFADLTIKGITLPISFNANVDYNEKEMTTKFKIDRQRWGIDYNSSVRDSAISDAIGFEVKLSL